MGKAKRLRAERAAQATQPAAQNQRQHHSQHASQNRQQRRAEQNGATSGSLFGSAFTPPTRDDQVAEIADLLQLAVAAAAHQRPRDVERVVAMLTDDDAPGSSAAAVHHRLVQVELQRRLLASVRQLWQRGWQPADVLRAVSRSLKADHDRLVGTVVVAELAGYAADTVDPRWAAQLAAADLHRWWPQGTSPLEALTETWQGGWPALVRTAAELLARVEHLAPLPQLGPLPGAARVAAPSGAAAAQRDVDARVLARVRALLAKAESTDFPAEAETFTAGAQALMAKHSIDAALLAATAARDGTGEAEGVTGVRIGVDAPYESAKAMLLQEIAQANRCRTVWVRNAGFSNVVGFPSDLSAVEVLYTSLLVQATTSLNAAGRTEQAGARSRSASYRRSYLHAYAQRIGERLAEATQQETTRAVDAAAAAGSRDLLPVLASRAHAVEEAVEQMFPEVQGSQSTVSDAAGWASGRAAADVATLSHGEALSGE